MNKIQLERLLKLADHLYDKVPRKEFTYSSWVRHTCQTPGCAGGYAAIIFRKEGLNLHNGAPHYKGAYGFIALSHFFDLTVHDTLFLFDPIYSGLGLKATPKQVAKHIRKFVKEKLAA